jgi:hypothetical protein
MNRIEGSENRSEVLSVVQARMSENSGSSRSLPDRLLIRCVLFAGAIGPNPGAVTVWGAQRRCPVYL